jgi:hypothetical protein
MCHVPIDASPAPAAVSGDTRSQQAKGEERSSEARGIYIHRVYISPLLGGTPHTHTHAPILACPGLLAVLAGPMHRFAHHTIPFISATPCQPASRIPSLCLGGARTTTTDETRPMSATEPLGGAAGGAEVAPKQREEEEAAAVRAVENVGVALDNISLQLDPLFAVPWDTLVSGWVDTVVPCVVGLGWVSGDGTRAKADTKS